MFSVLREQFGINRPNIYRHRQLVNPAQPDSKNSYQRAYSVQLECHMDAGADTGCPDSRRGNDKGVTTPRDSILDSNFRRSLSLSSS